MTNNISNPQALEDIKAILRKEIPELKREYHIKRIGVFGSFTKGTQTRKSDVDLIICFEKAPGLKFVKLSKYLEELLNRKVDVITPEGLKSIRTKEIRNDIEKKITYV